MKRRVSDEPLVQFRWAKPITGYRWVDAGSPPQLNRSRGTTKSIRCLQVSQVEVEFYEPLLRSPALFRTFADLQPTERDVLKFANQHGPLGISIPIVLRSDDWRVLRSGELLGTWADEIFDLRLALEVWDVARKQQNKGRLEQRISIRRDRLGIHAFFSYQTPEGLREELICSNRQTDAWRSELAAFLDERALHRAALFYVQGKINERLKEHTRARVLYSRPRDSIGLHTVPTNLLGAMWLQFAHAVEGRRDYKRCAECATWFEVSLEEVGYSRRREFCRPACRFKAYRERKTEACKLHKRGLSLQKIAKRLRSDPATIKGWISRKTMTPSIQA
jgi:hypothetical protein